MVRNGSAVLAPGTAERWLEEFGLALAAGAPGRVRDLLTEDPYWRDLLAFSWTIGWKQGAEGIAGALVDASAELRPSGIRLSGRYGEPELVVRHLREVLEVFFEFETVHGHGIGIVRLVPDAGSPLGARAWQLFTTLEDLHGYEGVSRGARKKGVGFSRDGSRRNWLDRRVEAAAFADHDPEVLIVGGGQAGVMSAARLGQLGVEALVVDRHPRVGDNWRTRYRSLALHNETDIVHFAYLPMPDTFPQYIPKDKLANWIEAYVEAMEINYWAATEFVSGDYDEEAGRWTVTIRRGGQERVMHPQHVIVATGNEGGKPRIPQLPGIADFAGDVLHTKAYRDGADYAGKNVLVVGVATSAHDVSLDLSTNGANVTMLQRNPTVIINIDTANVLLSLYTQGKPTDQIDLVSAANFIHPLFLENLKAATLKTAEQDRETIEALNKAGLRTDQGEDESGYLMKFFRYRGGYYINVGASEAIIRGDITIAQHEDLDTFVPEGVRLKDGTVKDYDAVILATGYLGPIEEIRDLFGDEVAGKIGAIGGYDPDTLEIRNTFTQTPQRGLWFIGGGISSCRIYSLHLALQIKAAQEGILPGYTGTTQTRQTQDALN
ncbi:NAD(P)/FAD-dependent oxidoreductase [Arthrobacter sp. AZCC_0090]|uniref:flavin-containing monooxygenase n=1 Tax=Arthrobacter sp. AZCC_0090 TaxID=2735881 RepID=UPI001615BF13|nr:NAD(P)/FAD-dependent oxidoreductase [Arthrobacter sp. AZCC_0090]MBB6407159.1 putative flavoprotein involved in K+ transport [Arthrobacter sp. AZCC_0090]